MNFLRPKVKATTLLQSFEIVINGRKLDDPSNSNLCVDNACSRYCFVFFDCLQRSLLINPFIPLEDEIILRRAVRSVYANEGMTGVYQSLGEMGRAMQIVAEVAKEIVEEEKKQ